MPKLDILRGSGIILQPNIDACEYDGQVMGENKITASFRLFQPFSFRVGDYITHRGVKYTLYVAPEESKTGKRKLDYILSFEAPEYGLYNTQLRHLNSGTFTFTGALSEMLDLITPLVSGKGWTKGNVTSTDIRTIAFDKDSCRSAITKMAELFELEYEFKPDKTININESVGRVLPGIVFSYGMNNGLKGLIRNPIEGNDFGTRFFGYGSSDNLPANYRSGATELQFEGFYVDSPNIGDYDEIFEKNAEFPDIKPERTAPIQSASKVTGTNFWIVTDNTLDFNLNDVIVDGAAKIVFKTGFLSGSEFEIESYNDSLKQIKFRENKEESGYILPNDTVRPNSGDTYTLIGITMPQSYIDAAEAKLKAATIDFANRNSMLKISYALDLDELYIRNMGLTQALRFGDKIRVVDTEMGIDTLLRIQKINYPVFNEGDIQAEINDTVTYTQGEKNIVDIINHEQEIRNEARVNYERARSRDISLRTLQNYIVDPEGNYYTEKIRPGSIETLYLAVGSKYTNFALKGVSFTANVNGNENAFQATTGQLVHFAIQIEGVGYVWEMAPYFNGGLNSDTTYYLYARVSRNALVGEWVLSSDVFTVEQVPGVWYFQTGVLFASINGYRNYELTKGMAYIIGDQITAGIIKSLDGLNFFNLTDGTFKLGDSTSGIDYGITEPNTLSIVGRIVATTAQFINLFVQNLRTAITGRRIEIIASSNDMTFYGLASQIIGGVPTDVEYEAFKLGDYIDSGQSGNPLGGIRTNTPEGDTSYMTGNGVFSNGSNMAFLPASSNPNTNSSLVGLLKARNSSATGISAAVSGIDQTTTGNSKSYAGYFQGNIGLYGAQYRVGKRVSVPYTILKDDLVIIVESGGANNVTLPPPDEGRYVTIKNIQSGTANTISVVSNIVNYPLANNQTVTFQYVGSAWVSL